ncbi:putative prophage LambdaBa02, tape measure protein [Paenibacillus alvei TS-15]|uniref:Putative prophage LambdaBa02, tape measure protein n=1 Tax=Paenibacillus alvei TS-15 TaxID=1117108 RepID=S9SRU7_PAEAL|nr:phage tail tape measure protein [Paenibacillus alvei]EPY07419.1 putative prophage LambdaBa02, tape measure protein [Paenibacillus alvei TS-15]
MKTYEIAYRLGGQLQASFLRSMGGAGAEMQKLYNQTQKVDKGIRKQANALDALKSKIAGTAAGIGAGAFAMASFKKAIDFEQQISSIQAVSGIAKQQMGEIEQLALDMGAKTKYSALESAQGIEELVKAGLSIDKIKGGGIEAALNLAAAGNLELADAAEIMSTAMNAFRSDAMEASHAADMLAGTANASATNVMELKFALAQASAVASGVGLSFDDTNAALGLFANNGLKGSDAGTSLKTMLLNLTPVTADAIGEFERLGLMTFDATKALQFLQSQGVKPASTATKDIVDAMMTYSAKTEGAKVGSDKANKAFREMAFNAGAMSSVFYDSAGNMANLETISGELNKALKDLTSQQRQVALKTMFGTDAVRAANILYKESAQGVKDFYAEASRVTALDVATTRLDNAKGSVELFRSAMETLQITGMKVLSPTLKKLADLGTEIASKHGKATMVLGGIALAAYPITKVTRGVIALTRAVGGFGVAVRLLSGPVGWAIAATTAIAGGIYLISTRSRRAREELLQLGKRMETSLGNYKQADGQLKRMNQLLAEYDRLKLKIDQAKAPASELAAAREKLRKVEQQLIDMNPEILKAEDAKTGRLREQAGLERDRLSTKQRSAKLDLQAAVNEAQAKMPEQKKMYQDAVADQKKWDKEYQLNIEKAQTLIELREKALKLQSDRDSGKVDAQREQALLREVQDKTGIKMGVSVSADSLQNGLDQAIKKQEEANKKKAEAEQIIRELSDTALSALNNFKELTAIEQGLDVPLEEAAKKYSQLTTEQKAKTEAVIKKVNEFAQKLEGLPNVKTVEITTLFKQIGQLPPNIQPPSSRDVPTAPGGFKAYADGGIAFRPHLGLTAEKGPEAMIPLASNKRSRALSLYDQVGKALGVRDYASGGLKSKLQRSGVSAPVVNPINLSFGDFNVTVQGSADEGAMAQLRREMEQHKRNILAAVQEATRQKGRVRLA